MELVNLLLLLLLSYTPCFVSSNSPGNVTDRLSLLMLRDGITRDPSNVLHTWNESTHFCEWEGVTCGKKHPVRVTGLYLSSLDLAGEVASSISNLTFLQEILLDDNGFYGLIPQDLYRLRRLRHLNLSFNSFQGEIPVNLSSCSELLVLDLNRNLLTGEIPGELGSLLNLDTLGLAHNNLTGVIPRSFGNLTSLVRISFSYNEIKGRIPEELGRLNKLGYLTMAANMISGTIPNSIFNLSSLYLLVAASNRLHGSLPPTIGTTLPNLEILYLAINELDGPIPTSLSNATYFLELDMASNEFTGRVPPEFGRLQYLYNLNLNLNRLEANDTSGWEFLTSFANCTSLEKLQIAANNLGGALPSSIANLSAGLQQLVLQRNPISGTIPHGLGNLVNLAVLALYDNLHTGVLPESIGRLRSLQWMGLYSNRLRGRIPSSFGNLTKLIYLGLADNQLEGPIPSSLGNLGQLNTLYMSRNNLSGTIPKELVSVSSISNVFDLADNSLAGPLPKEIGSLKHLEALYLNGNKLSGKIPDELGNCQSLEYLMMGNNFFNGSIPPSVSNIKGLRELDLSRNNLSGHIPETMGSLRGLLLLNLSFNRLIGDVPIKGVFGNITALALEGNQGLCGGIPELNLTGCPLVSSRRARSVRLRILIPAVITTFVSLLLSVSGLVYFYSRRRPRKEKTSKIILDDKYHKISYRELAKATNGFSSENIVGKGRYGSVYRATLGNTTLAVKVIDLQQQGGTQSFIAECEVLRSLRHRNLLKILTSCSSADPSGNDFKALVFEFMPNGSLDVWLHGERRHELTLAKRLDIAIDISEALNYLHHGCETPVVHCDLKPSNVLLSDDKVAHVTDFGLARILPQAMSRVSTGSIGIRGTIGYVAPEYGAGIGVSTSGDVYSFGILLLEMLTGKKPVDDMFKDGISLHSFVTMAYPDSILDIIDPELQPEGDTVGHQGGSMDREHESLSSLLRVGLSCSNDAPRQRMNMEDATVELHKIRQTYKANITGPSHSTSEFAVR